MVNKVEFIISADDQASGVIEKLQSGIKGIGENGKYSKTELAAAGTAIIGTLTAIGVSAVNTFADFEKQMSSAKAVLWLFGDDEKTKQTFQELTTLAMDLWATTKFTSEEAAEGITILWQAGFDAAQIMQALPAALDLAAAQNISVAQSADIASSVLRQYWKDVSETGSVMDVLSSASIKSNATILDLSESFNYFWPTAKVLGISLEESAAAIGILANNGLKGSMATRALGTALTRLADPTEKMAWGLKAAGVQAFDATGKFVGLNGMLAQLRKGTADMSQEQKAATISAIFGADAYAEINILLDSGADALANFTAELEKSEGTTQSMAKVLMDNVKGSLELFSGSIDALKIKLGAALAPAVVIVTDALTTLANWIGVAFDWFNKLPAPVKNITMILLGVAVAGVAIVSAIAVLSVALSGVGAAFVAIWSAALPFIGIAAAIGVAVYALYEAYQHNFLWIKTVVDIVWWAIKTAFAAIIAAGVYLYENWDLIKQKAVEIWWSMIQWLVDAWTWAVTKVSEIWWAVTGFFEGVWNWIVAIFKFAIALVVGIVIATFNAMWIDIVAVFNTVKEYINIFWEGLKLAFNLALIGIKIIWEQTWWAVKKVAIEIWDSISSKISSVWNVIKEMVSTWMEFIANVFHTLADPIMQAWSSLWEGLSTAVVSVWETVKTTIRESMNWIIDKINAVIEMANRVAAMWSKAVGINIITIPTLPRFAHGWMVWMLDGGVVTGAGGLDKVPAMLSAGEVVLNAAQQQNVARGLEGNGWMTVEIHVAWNNFYWDDANFAQKIGKSIMEEFKLHTSVQSFS